jgi:hypothetical protein
MPFGERKAAMDASSFRHAINAFLTVQFAVHKLLMSQFANLMVSFSRIESVVRHLSDMNRPTLLKIRH